MEWSDSRRGKEVAAGAFPWSVNGIVLLPGLNVIEVTAFDAAGNAASDSLAVTYTIPAPQLGVSIGSNGELQLELSGAVGSTWAIQTSTDLSQWQPFTTVTIPAQGSVSLSDASVNSQPVRYYRAKTP